MNNEAKIMLQRKLDDIREHIREYSSSMHEQDKWIASIEAQARLWRKELQDEIAGKGEDKNGKR